jgi:hypothetical protein
MKFNLKGGFALIVTLAVAVGVAVILVKAKAPLEHVRANRNAGGCSWRSGDPG